MSRVSIEFYMNTQIFLAFWLVLAYDLLEDRRPIDAIITRFQGGIPLKQYPRQSFSADRALMTKTDWISCCRPSVQQYIPEDVKMC